MKDKMVEADKSVSKSENLNIDTCGMLYGVGVGPGDPELMTYKAVRIIKMCDTIIVPTEPIESSYAYQIVRKMIPEIDTQQILAMPFPMTKDVNELETFYQESYERIEKLLRTGKNVAFLTIGDPSIYSTYMFIDHKVREHGGKTELISGIPSFCAVASRLGIALGEKEEMIHMIPGSYDITETKKLSGTRVYMKSGKKLAELKAMLQEEAKINSLEVYYVSNCGLENEKVGEGVESIDPNLGYLTIIIVKNK